KPTLILSASPGALGGARAQYHLRQVLVALDAPVMNMPEVMISQANKKIEDGAIVDEGTSAFVGKQLAAFKTFVEKHL
ncbi:NAD(P)H-dependent oxidoreductase, partial [Klebsiella pneumoniae]|nr:NAD(P)H-dependent oxidoreductase [Klebsiella pneumoniae]